MGTETFPPRFVVFYNRLRYVKLNNPLMGMETEQQFLDPLVYVILIVKLNNPLMGTETI